MQKYSNRMEKPANREQSEPKAPELEAKPPEPTPKEAPGEPTRGFPCRWCKSRNTKVKKTYSSMKRMRFCLHCGRTFQTIETAP